jgi:hypothetical protein
MIEGIKLDKPRLYVDLNELIAEDLVLLSAHDSKVDSSGTTVSMKEGMQVFIYCDDNVDEDDRFDPFIADGIIERARPEHEDSFLERVPWRCRIDSNGLRLMSEEFPQLQARFPIWVDPRSNESKP